MNCNICQNKTSELFKEKVLNKYDVKYFQCKQCGFIQTEKPYWIKEAYHSPITNSDTGIMYRNEMLVKNVCVLLYNLFDKDAKYLDCAGGYGIFTRMMRDIGFDFYWKDKYSTNLVARGFEYTGNEYIELITAFEAFEHFENPLEEIENLLKISKNIIFSTELASLPAKDPKDWYYYCLEHGQHISIYTFNTLNYIARKYGLRLCSNGFIHLLTEKQIDNKKFKKLLLNAEKQLFNKFKYGLFDTVKQEMTSKTVDDMYCVINKINENNN